MEPLAVDFVPRVVTATNGDKTEPTVGLVELAIRIVVVYGGSNHGGLNGFPSKNFSISIVEDSTVQRIKFSKVNSQIRQIV